MVENDLVWTVRSKPHCTIAFFEIAREDGLLDPGGLRSIELPQGVKGKENRGLIIGGRGPIWLYAHLTHLAHVFAWVGLYDPRYRGAVVVQRHTTTSPPLGDIVPCEIDRSTDSS